MENINVKKLLIVGLGDVARRTLPLLGSDWQVVATCRGGVDITGFELVYVDLDDVDSLRHLPVDVDVVLYTVPPPSSGVIDVRMSAFLSFWRKVAYAPAHFVYISTTGVYGDCSGAWVDELTELDPQSARAVRRVSAESQLREFAAEAGMSLTVLRAPGIYALERLPLERIRKGLPVLSESEDSFSNHIHGDDLAMMCVAALLRPRGVVAYNACDDLPLKMGEWFTQLAAAAGLPTPPRISLIEAANCLSALQWSFMRESRRLSNAKIKIELAVTLRYPTVLDFLRENESQIRIKK